LYLHIPFCKSLCYFCACTKVITRDRSPVAPYLSSLEAELRHYADFLGTRRELSQIHYGGGSPSYLTEDEVARIQEQCIAAFPRLAEHAELSIELDPRTTSPALVRRLSTLGFNRVSFGVQDFDPEVQHTINRKQSFEETAALCDAAREAGFSGVNVDLIYGLPGQTTHSFERTLEQVLELLPDRVALYGYAHVTWLKKVQRALERAHLPSPEERLELFLLGIHRFIDAGYRYIGMDHFARENDSLSRALDDGTINRNFMGYTTQREADVLGVGMSAISSFQHGFSQNNKALLEYQSLLAEGALPFERGLLTTREDRMRADAIHRVLCGGVIDGPDFERMWGTDFRELIVCSPDVVEAFQRDGLIACSSERLEVTPFLGRVFMRNIAMLFDARLSNHLAKSNPVFSQTV
ncbi:MAG: oxygen-independent coproporphyrinogen III oxidase, partial [Bdellovibrionales bacterium]|nr:oxygen-independent coproporphyrinogen III oxidase [Bdellovibrionales bacterium]